MSPVAAAARKGDRISHASRMDDHDGPALLGAALGALVAAPAQGGVTAAAMGAGVACGSGGRVTTRDVIPYTVSGAVEDGAPDVLIGAGKLPAALAAAQKVTCHHHSDKPLRTGSATVFAGALRLARQTDEAGCGALVCDGEATVLVGGAPQDGAPPDPLALLTSAAGTAATRGAAVLSAALGVAIAAGGSAVEAATRWGEALADEATGAAGQVVSEGEAAAGELGARLGALVGTASAGVTGAVLGDTLGG